ncbi:hypothetical protein D3C76_774530 [compost metagenome]
MKTVKELRVEAKELNIKGYGKMKKDQLIDAIGAASVASRNQQQPQPQDPQDDFFTPDEHGDVDVVVPVIRKRIEYVMADNTQVCFFADGQKVRVYWDTTTYKLTIHSERRGRRPISYANLIRMFKPLTNGADGDVARVVKAIVRIKDMPAAIKVHRMNKLVESGKVPARRTKEKAEASKSTRGKVDPQWMQRYVEWCLETSGVKPSGLEIRDAWLQEQQA